MPLLAVPSSITLVDSKKQCQIFADHLATPMLLTVVWEPHVGVLGEAMKQRCAKRVLDVYVYIMCSSMSCVILVPT